MRRSLVVMVLIGTMAVACDGDRSEPQATSTTVASVTTTSIRVITTPPMTDTMPPDATTVPPTSTAASSIDVEISDGVVSGPDVFEVDLGETVAIWVLSDVDDEIHVHGYDRSFDLDAGVPFRLGFVADIPGIFEVEAHTGHIHLFEIRVTG